MASSTPQAKPSSSVKLVLLGEAAVGKSSLVLRFVNNDFQENKEPTIGAAFLTQKCTLPSRTIKFEIWDTAGQERFASLAPMYYRNAQAALVVYDITKPHSLVKAQHWVAELHRQASPGIVISLVGNKSDLADELAGDEEDAAQADAEAEEDEDTDAAPAQDGAEPTSSTSAATAANNNKKNSTTTAKRVPTATARAYAEEEDLLFFETSAKTGHNVTEVFTAIANAIPETSLKGPRGGGVGGQTRLGGGGAGGQREDARVDLGRPGAEGPKEGCAC